MKAGNYPEYIDTKVTCACGNTFTVKSNKEELHLEVCNKCHPTFVGKADANAVSRAGRVEKFMKKYGLDKEAK